MVRAQRARLTERLKRSLSLPVTIIEGPAGCGKSVALADALAADEQPHALFDVAPEHARLSAFIQGLADAIAPWAPGARVAFASAYNRALVSTQPTQNLAVWLKEHLKDIDLTIAIDNLHNAAPDPLIREFLTRLIDQEMPAVRWVVAARTTHFLPLANWLAYARMELPLTEADLAFTPDEIADLARARRVAIGSADAIAERTGGWATGVSSLVRADADPHDASPARALEPLIERLLTAYDPADLRSLLATYYLPELSVELLLAIGGRPLAQQVDALRARAPFVFTGTERAPRYHDRFREALRARLAAVDPEQKQAALDSASYVLTHYRRFVEFLSLQLSLGNPAACIAVLEEHGIELIEHGNADLVESVIASLQYRDAELPASVVALRATIDSRLGKFDTAESWFNQAIARATNDDVRMIEIKYLYACDLLRRDRPDALPLLREHAFDESLPAQLRAGILSALAEAYQLANDPEAARTTMDRAIALEQTVGDEDLHARVIGRAAYVYLYQNDYPTAERLAREAARAATAASQFMTAVSAYSVLYVVAFDTENVIAALAAIDMLLESCLKSGNLQFQFYCIACSFEIEMERNNVAAIERIDATLRSFDVSYESSVSDEAFLPGDALRSAMHGDFARAYRVLHPSAPHQAAADRIALRWAEVALYAAGAGQNDDAAEAVTNSLAVLALLDESSNRASRARLFLALTLALLGRIGETAPLLAAVAAERDAPERIRAIEAAVVALCAYVAGSGTKADVTNAFAMMGERECGGIARVFEALPWKEQKGSARLFVTPVAPLTLATNAMDDVDVIINDLITRLFAKDAITAEHSRAVSSWCARIARKMGLSSEDTLLVQRGGLLHDIGKITTPDIILNAPRGLTEEEFAIIRRHPQDGVDVIAGIPELAAFTPAILDHHERIDGTGYPSGLRGDEIPFSARLVSVADCFNAMVGRRPYRPALSPYVAIRELSKHAGRQFDPDVVEAMIAVVMAGSDPE